MAKLATQTIVIRISKAVSDDDSDNIIVLDDETLDQLNEAVVALVGDNGAVVELTNE